MFRMSPSGTWPLVVCSPGGCAGPVPAFGGGARPRRSALPFPAVPGISGTFLRDYSSCLITVAWGVLNAGLMCSMYSDSTAFSSRESALVMEGTIRL